MCNALYECLVTNVLYLHGPGRNRFLYPMNWQTGNLKSFVNSSLRCASLPVKNSGIYECVLTSNMCSVSSAFTDIVAALCPCVEDAHAHNSDSSCHRQLMVTNLLV